MRIDTEYQVILVVTRSGACFRYWGFNLRAEADEVTQTLRISHERPDGTRRVIAVYSAKIWAAWSFYDEATHVGVQMPDLADHVHGRLDNRPIQHEGGQDGEEKH